MRKIAMAVALAAAVFVAACSETTKIGTRIEFQILNPPASITVCNPIKKSDFPKGDRLTNKQLHAFILKLYKNNQLCAANMAALREYIKKTNASILENMRK